MQHPAPVDSSTKLFTVVTIAEEWQCSVSHIWNTIAAGELKTIKMGRSTRITHAEARRYISKKEAA